MLKNIFFEKQFLVVCKNMCKCIKTRLYPIQMLKNIFFKNMILVVWKYAKMHQNTFLPPPDGQIFEKKFMVVWKYAQMHQNTFLPLQMLKNICFEDVILVVWKNAKMHQNTFLTTPDGQKYFF